MTLALLSRGLEAVDRLTRAMTADEVLQETAGVLGEFGFTAFLLTRLPRPPAPVEAHVLLNGWPAGWTERYMEAGHYAYDPVARHCMQSVATFSWEELPPELLQHPMATRIASEATEFDLRHGVCVPLHTALGAGGLSLAGPDIEHPPGLRGLITLLAFLICQRVEDVGEPSDRAPSLSPRERDVLSWIALGKTVEDVADILGISAHTVGEHLKHVRHKLNTTNSVHSVVRALQLGQLRL